MTTKVISLKMTFGIHLAHPGLHLVYTLNTTVILIYHPGCGLGYRIYELVSFFDLQPNQATNHFVA